MTTIADTANGSQINGGRTDVYSNVGANNNYMVRMGCDR